MSKQQTAVECLVEQMKLDELFNADYFIQQAIEMEKQQIIDAHKHGFTEGTCFGATTIYKFTSAEQYYKQTFNK